ncbi:type II toxin-antitoxin system RelE/ParE family toxin [Ottowia sp.]|uniref:type II toxin-antitoxin system RelE/ParE family toxin n=1 Tax=Ottowia sp. TaxID=1898956 RepID=UPI002C4A873A|nr:type II toxin-antitoxin system RelE/ParE family toxin [Ottowia sp.]
MTRIEGAPEVLDDFDRFFEHLTGFEVAAVCGRLQEIFEAIQVLARRPWIGRPIAGGKRELAIGQGSLGCVALHQYLAEIDTALVLACARNARPVSNTGRQWAGSRG